MKNLTIFGNSFSEKRNLKIWEIYLQDYHLDKISFKDACVYLGQCFSIHKGGLYESQANVFQK